MWFYIWFIMTFFWQNATNIIGKCDSYFVIKCDKLYYKVVQLFCYKKWKLLENAAVITKCDVYDKMDMYRAKLRSLWQVHFIPPVLYVLTLAFDVAVLYGNVALSIAVLSTKNWYSSFSRKVCVFHKTCFKVKALKMLKIFGDCHVKTCKSFKRILKISSTGF